MALSTACETSCLFLGWRSNHIFCPFIVAKTSHVIRKLCAHLPVLHLSNKFHPGKRTPATSARSEYIMLMAQLVDNYRQQHIDHLWIDMAMSSTSVVTKSLKERCSASVLFLLMGQLLCWWSRDSFSKKNQHFSFYRAKTINRFSGQSMYRTLSWKVLRN